MERMTGISGAALYFPRIEMPSKGWALSQLLLWDRIQRIVPDGHFPHDSEDIHQLCEANLILPISPTPHKTSAEAVLQASMEHQLKRGGTIFDRLRNHRSRVKETLGDISHQNFYYLHLDKLTDKSRETLEKLGAKQEGNERWLKAEDRLVYLYMCCLAHTISESINSPLITYHTQSVGWQLSFRNLKPSNRGMLKTLLDLQINWPSEAELESLSIRKFFKWRDKTTLVRQDFRKYLFDVHSELAGISNPDEYRSQILSHKDALQAHLREYHAALDELGVKSFTGAVRMCRPTALVATSALLAPTLPTVAIPLAVLGVGWSLVEARATYREGYRKIVSSNPASYVAMLQHKFGSDSE